MRRNLITLACVIFISFCSKDEPPMPLKIQETVKAPQSESVKPEAVQPETKAEVIPQAEAQKTEEAEIVKPQEPEELAPVEIPSWEIKEAGKKVEQIIDSLKRKDEFSKELSEIEALGKAASPRLAQYFLDPTAEWQKRWLSGMGLGRTMGPGAKEALMKGLNDKLSVIKMASAIALKHFPEAEVVDKLHELFRNDKGMLVRNTIINTLVEVGDPRSVPVLASGLNNDENFYRGKNLWIRNNIVYAMGKFKNRNAVPHLIEILNKKDESLYDIALKSLEYIVEPKEKVQTSGITLEEKDKDYEIKWWLSWWDKHKSDYL